MKRIPALIILKVLLVIIILNFPPVVHGADKNIVLSTPEIRWAMRIEAPGFALDQRRVGPGGADAYFMASNKTTGVIMSGQIERVGKTGTARDAREYFWEGTKKAPFRMDDVKMSESGQMTTVEYVIREHEGVLVNQKNLWAYLAKDQYWINIHLSKMNFQPGEEALFRPILQSVVFEDKRPGEKIESSYRVSEKYVLTLNVPCSWQDEIQRPKPDLPPNIVFRPDKMPASEIHVTPIWSPQGEAGFNSPQTIRNILEEGGTPALSGSVEKELGFREIKGREGLGYYFTLTDKAPHIKPGEYKHMTQGGIGVGSLLVMFTILTNEKDSALVPAGLEMVANSIQK